VVRSPRRRARWGHRCVEAEDDPRADGGSVAASRRGRDARALDDVDADQIERGNAEGLEVSEEAGGEVDGVTATASAAPRRGSSRPTRP
jgi:hypothetical protein